MVGVDDIFHDPLYLRALTFEGPTKDNPVLDPLAVLHLNNRLLLSPVSPVFYTSI